MNDWKLLKWLLHFVRPFIWLMLIAISFGVLSNLVVLLIPMFGIVIALQLLGFVKINLSLILTILISLGVLRGIARYIEQYCNHNIAFHLLAHVRDQIFQTIRKIGPSLFTKHQSGDLMTMISTDVEALEVFFAHTISPFFIALIFILLVFAVASHINLTLAILLLTMHLIAGFIVPYFSYKHHKKIGDDYKQTFVEVSQIIMEDMHSLSTIKEYNLLHDRQQKLKTANLNLNFYNRLKIKNQAALQSINELIIISTCLLMIVVGITLHLNPMSIIFFSILSLSSFGPIFALNQLGNALLTTLSSGRRLYNLMHIKPAVEFPVTPSTTNHHDYANVHLSNISFGYSDDTQVLRDINLTAELGQIIGIQGPSGSGKSTLLHLLLRYFDLQTGQITINSNQLKDFTKEQLAAMESLMEQQTFIFHDTIWNNLTLHNPKFSEKDVIKAAKEANLHDFICSLDDKYQTKISQLSAGETQRLGLARMFLYDAPLFLLDEPTSHLDYLNELSILQTLTAKKKHKTMIIASHRQTTMQRTDQIYKLHHQ